MIADESDQSDARIVYGRPRLHHGRLQRVSGGGYSESMERPQLDGGRQRLASGSSSSRYVEAQMRNRLVLTRLVDQRQSLERQRQHSTTIMDRNMRKFAEQMANVGRRSSDLTPSEIRRRQRAAAAGLDPFDEHDADSTGISPALAGLRLDDRVTVERRLQRRRRPTTATGYVSSVTGVEVGSRQVAAATNSASHQPHQRNSQPSRTSADRRAMSHSAAARSATPRQQHANVKRTATFTGAYIASAVPSARSAKMHQRTRSQTDFATTTAAAAENRPESSDAARSRTNADEIDAVEKAGESSSSRWRRDLRREAPPAVYGPRRSVYSHHAVLSQAERRRRLVALQSRQTALPAAVHRPKSSLTSRYSAPL